MNPDNKPSKLFHWLLPLVCSIVLVMIHPYTMAESAFGKSASPPPSVELEYVVRVKITAMSIGGSSTIKWDKKNDAYSIVTSAKGNVLGKVLDSSSNGHITAQGLKPDIFREKRLGKDETTVTFNRKNNTLIFSESAKTVPLEKGVQDRASIVWQLISMARANPELFSPGNKLTFRVSGRNQIDLWNFNVEDETTIQTALGEIKTVYLKRQDQKGKTIEVWLAPDKEWYPVKLIFDDNKNLRLEQTIQKITPK